MCIQVTSNGGVKGGVAPAEAAVAQTTAAAGQGKVEGDGSPQQKLGKPASSIIKELEALTPSSLWSTGLALREVNQRLCRATSLAPTLSPSEKTQLELKIDKATTLSTVFRKVRNSAQAVINPQQEFDKHECGILGNLDMVVLKPFMAAVVKKIPEDSYCFVCCCLSIVVDIATTACQFIDRPPDLLSIDPRPTVRVHPLEFDSCVDLLHGSPPRTTPCVRPTTRCFLDYLVLCVYE